MCFKNESVSTRPETSEFFPDSPSMFDVPVPSESKVTRTPVPGGELVVVQANSFDGLLDAVNKVMDEYLHTSDDTTPEPEPGTAGYFANLFAQMPAIHQLDY